MGKINGVGGWDIYKEKKGRQEEFWELLTVLTTHFVTDFPLKARERIITLILSKKITCLIESIFFFFFLHILTISLWRCILQSVLCYNPVTESTFFLSAL